MVFGASTVGRRSASGCRPLSVPSPPTQISPSMPSFVSRDAMRSSSAFLLGIDVVARRADQRAALGRIQFRDRLKQRIQMHVRNARIEEAVESLDEAEDLDPELVGARDRAVNGGVERGRVAAGREDADAFHCVERGRFIRGRMGRLCEVVSGQLRHQPHSFRVVDLVHCVAGAFDGFINLLELPAIDGISISSLSSSTVTPISSSSLASSSSFLKSMVPSDWYVSSIVAEIRPTRASHV